MQAVHNTSRSLRSLAALMSIVLLVSACVPAETARVSAVSKPATGTADAAVVSAARAVAMFRDVCGKTAGAHFAGATQRMAAYKVTAPSPLGTSTLYSTIEDLSFKIMDGPGYGKTCSIVYASNDNEAATAAVHIANFGKPKMTEFGITAFDKAAQRLVIINRPTRNAGRTYYNLKMLSDGG